MNEDQIETVADKAWELANEPDTDFEACVLLKDCAFTIKELQSRLESLEQEMQEQARIIGMGAERELALVAKVESMEKDAARYRVIRNSPYSDNYGDLYAMTFQRLGDVPLKAEELDYWADDAIARYAAMQANKGE